MSDGSQVAEIRSGLEALFPRGTAFEVRAIDVPTKSGYTRTYSGYFNDLDLAAEAIDDLDQQGAPGVYFTLNRCDPSLLARANNRVKLQGKRGKTTSDHEVTRRTYLLFDIDPKRASGIAATDAEMAAAQELAAEIEDILRARGWPHPLIVFSGNGFYLLWPIDEPNDDETTDLIKRFYAGMKTLLSEADAGEPRAEIDTSVYNAARIIRAPGTTNRKGDKTDDRPHRRCELYPPTDECPVEVVARSQIEEIANLAPVEAPTPTNAKHTSNGHSRLDVECWLTDRGLSYSTKEGSRGQTIFRLDECVFDPNHKSPDAAFMQEEDGRLGYKCLHNSCSGYGWQEAKEAVGKPDPDHYDPPLIGNGHAKNGRQSPTVVTAMPQHAYHLTDTGNAERLANNHHDKLQYCWDQKMWYAYDGRRWYRPGDGQAMQCATESARDIYRMAADEPDKDRRDRIAKWAHQSESAPRIHAAMDLARSQAQMTIAPDQFNRDQMLLNCINGTIDLRSGELRQHRPDDYITQMCPWQYNAEAECPRWVQFIDEIFLGNPHLVQFIQRLVGYTLTGLTREQVLVILYGTGSNGKSVFIETIMGVMGDYAGKAPENLLMRKRDSHPTEIANLLGKRFVAAVETEQNQRLAESRVKELTGSDTLSARRMKEDFWDFMPTHKLYLSCNHRPRVLGTDTGIWRRLRLIPFDFRAVNGENLDNQLPAKLRKEMPGILTWAVKGCLEWQEQGLGEPDEVMEATEGYRNEEDVLQGFLNERCKFTPNLATRASDLLDAYRDHTGDKSMTQRRFGKSLTERSFERFTSNGTWYRGIELVE